jgi:hypothetical protein
VNKEPAVELDPPKKTVRFESNSLIAERAVDFNNLSKEEFIKKYPDYRYPENPKSVESNSNSPPAVNVPPQKQVEPPPANETPQTEASNPKDEKEIETSTEKKVRQLLGYAPKPFVECSIPASVQKGLDFYERTNGKASLSLTAVNPKKYDLPSGKDRVFFYWIRTQATMKQSRIVPFNGVNSTLEEMGMESNQRNIEWVKLAIMKSHNTLIYYTVGDPLKGGSSRGELIIPAMEGINFEEKRKRQVGTLHVSSHFYDPAGIPIDLNVIKEFGRCWIAMDLYTFIIKRLYCEKNGRKSDVFIKQEDLPKQFGFPSDSEPKHIKEYMGRAIKALKAANFEAIPFFDRNNTFVIPYIELRSILTLEGQIAFSHLDGHAAN